MPSASAKYAVLGLEREQLVGVLVEDDRIDALVAAAVTDGVLDGIGVFAHHVLDEPRQQRC
jgi:hypothetical protein